MTQAPLPSRRTIERGEPIDPAVIGPRVYARRSRVAPNEQRDFEQNRVVVHPLVFEDAWMRVRDLPYWSDHPRHTGLADLRCCGLLVESDPALRYDEVRLRREESLR